MVVTFLLGFVAAWRHDFGSKDAPTLNRMVLLYAVPLALFAGTVTTSRAALGQDIPLVIALCVAIIGFYGVVFLLCRSGKTTGEILADPEWRQLGLGVMREASAVATAEG